MAFWPRRSDWVILLSRISCCAVCRNGAETNTECYRRPPLNALLHSFTECRALFSWGRLGTLTFWPRQGKARLALRVPTLQVTIDWVITGSNSELVLWENPSWYHFYWAIWMNYVDWSPICPLDWIGFYDNLENNLFQNWSSKYSRMHGSFFSSFPSCQHPWVCLWMFRHYCSVRRGCVCMKDVYMGEIMVC